MHFDGPCGPEAFAASLRNSHCLRGWDRITGKWETLLDVIGDKTRWDLQVVNTAITEKEKLRHSEWPLGSNPTLTLHSSNETGRHQTTRAAHLLLLLSSKLCQRSVCVTF